MGPMNGQANQAQIALAGGQRSRENFMLSAFFALVISTNSGLAFSYPAFSSTAGLNLVGTPAQNGNVLRLTPAPGSQLGSSWYTQPQHVTAGCSTSYSSRSSSPAPAGPDG